ncbi:MAG: peptidylprolyl isomerase [Rikenellaceae bacterium]
MATLNTLRTKFGIVLSAVIALALLAFIFSLGSDMNFSGSNNPQVGEIDGKPVNYSDYIEMYERVREMSGVNESNQEISNQIAQAAWDAIFNQMAVVPGYQELGIVMGEAERLSVMNGQTPTQALYTYFADPSTGEFNVAAVSSFLAHAASDAQASKLWNEILADAASERSAMKFVSILRNGIYATDLEVEAGANAANNSYSGSWVVKRYSDIPDSLYSVSEREMRDFYNKNKESRYKQTPSKSVQYVEFAIAPTPEDELAIEREMAEIAEAFKASESPRLFAREHTRGSVSSSYFSESQLNADEAKAVLANQFYGPAKANNVWTVSKAIEVITAPDSLSLRQLALPISQSQMADSLLTALNRRGASFEAAVAQYSIFTQNGAPSDGNLGRMAFTSIPMEFASALASARKGQVVKVESGDYIQLLQVYETGKATKYAQVASIDYPVEASQSTIDALYSDASSFALMAKGGAAAFKTAADSLHVTPLTFATTPADRSVRAIENSSPIATWANNAKVGEISQIFKAGDGYVVAVVQSDNRDKYRSFNQVESAIRNELLRDKKFEGFTADFSASSLEDAAAKLESEIEQFEGVQFSSYYIPGVGIEPRVIGAITATTAGELSAPVKGNMGVYLFVVDNVAVVNDQTPEAQKVRIESAQQDYIQQAVFNTMKNLANIDDQRGKYF